MGLQKAQIVALEGKLAGSPVKALFNPQQYSIKKTNNWQGGDQAGPQSNAPTLAFSGGTPDVLSMELFFDTYVQSKGAASVVGVFQYTALLAQLMDIDPSLKEDKSQFGRPPRVKFVWGKTWHFDAVITDMDQKFTMFAPDGTPVRATVNVTFRQCKDAKIMRGTNPTSGGMGGERVWTVQHGDSLASIAERALGNQNLWRAIADVNHLEDVRELTPGSTLFIPTRP